MLALKPLEERFGIESLFVSTMQAVSGAGYPGVASLDILGNVVPFIKNEEEKLQEEVGKLLGRLDGSADRDAGCEGERALQSRGGGGWAHGVREHQAADEGDARGDPGGVERVCAAGMGQNLPTAPEQPVEFDAAVDRPQPRLDRMRGHGMAATVGRLRECNLLDWKFVVLSHNTIRGAAGAAVLNAEVLARLGKLDKLGVMRRRRAGRAEAVLA